MCLYGSTIPNKRFTITKKNGGNIPPIIDSRTQMVPTQCGQCMECRATISRDWKVRLQEDIRKHTNGKFITLTFSNESIHNIINSKPTKKWKGLNGIEGYALDNAIATRAVELFRERYRKQFKKSIRHWLITELGHKGTENLHLHGIIWPDTSFTLENLKQLWNYGYTWPRYEKDWKDNYVSNKTINYITKYVTKVDTQHKYYKPRILTSPGMGAHYLERTDWHRNKFNGEDTIEYYKTREGFKIAMPKYWKNKIYTDEEKEQLWIQKLNSNIVYVNGERIDLSLTPNGDYYAKEYARKINKELGYRTNRKNDYEMEKEHEKRVALQTKRITDYFNYFYNDEEAPF